jgi:hypothetical protein
MSIKNDIDQQKRNLVRPFDWLTAGWTCFANRIGIQFRTTTGTHPKLILGHGFFIPIVTIFGFGHNIDIMANVHPAI